MENKIHCGDALELLGKLEICPDLIIVSPPDLAETHFSFDEYREFLGKTIIGCANVLRVGGVLASATTDRRLNGMIYTKHKDILTHMENIGWQPFHYKIWAKPRKIDLMIPTFVHIICFRKAKTKTLQNNVHDFLPDVWDLPLDKVAGYKNKDSFPSELVRRLVLKFTNEGDLVLDPFIGTGKTAVVCNELNRRWIGFELDPSIVSLANSRLSV